MMNDDDGDDDDGDDGDEYVYYSMILTCRLQAVQDAREIFWKHLRKIPFNVSVPEDSEFVHVGTTVSKLTLALIAIIAIILINCLFIIMKSYEQIKKKKDYFLLFYLITLFCCDTDEENNNKAEDEDNKSENN